MRKKAVLACSVCQSRNYTTDKKTSSSERIEIKSFVKRVGVIRCIERRNSVQQGKGDVNGQVLERCQSRNAESIVA